MNRSRLPFQLTALLVLLTLLVAACGAPAGNEPAADEPAAAEEADAEATEAPEEETAGEDNIEEVDTSTEGSIAEESVGITVVSDEDVTTPRDVSLFGGERRSAASSDAVSFHPYITTDTGSSGYQGLVYDGALLRLDEETLQYIPHMAESYTISDDGLTFTFTLREGLEWSDGMPMTAQDWKWTWDQIIKEENGWPRMNQYAFITSYEALDDRTIEIGIDEIYAPALGQVASVVTPLPRQVWEELPWDDPEENPEINAPSITSGPYVLEEWERDQYVRFVANPNWWYNGTPLIERRTSEIVPDQDIVFEMFKSGETDIHGIRPENLEDVEALDNVTVYSYWPAAASWSYIGLNMRESSPLGNLNVRRGINYAIDKQLMTDEIMLGQAQRLCGPFPETSWVYNENINCYEYNVEQAIAEFEEAGYTYDGTTMFTPEGEPLELTLIYGPNTSAIRELIAITAQDYLGQIGIDVEIQGLEWSTFLEATDAAEPDWDMFVSGWSATIEPQIMFTIWAEDSIGSLNSVAYINKEVEALFDEAGGTYDLDVRKEKYDEIQEKIVDDAPYVFLWYNKVNAGVNDRVQGVDPKPLGLTWNDQDWWLEDAGE